jgi:polygalacturonase
MDQYSRRSFLNMTRIGIPGAIAGLSFPLVGNLASAAARELSDAVHSQRPSAATFDVKAYGALGDGKAIDSVAINAAINAASAAGGGLVCFPAGVYLCFSIRLKSGVFLQLNPGVVLMAAPPGSLGHYDAAEPNSTDAYQDYGHSHWQNSLIHGDGLVGIGIVGAGLICGKGLSAGYPHDASKAEDPGSGNKALALKNCRNVILRDFSILQGGHFAILATGTDNLTIDNLTIDTNRDGMDIDCCRNVHIANCSVNSPLDDGICLKSSYGLGYARTTERVTITNCSVSGFEMGSLLDGTNRRNWPQSPWRPTTEPFPPTGRIKFGTESNGGFRDVTISNCVFDFCRGLALETVDGGLIEDVSVSNVTMREATSSPFFLRLGSRMRGPAGVAVGRMRRISIDNVVCTNAVGGLGSIISGVPGYPIEELTLSNIQIEHQGGIHKADAPLYPPEQLDMYPEANMFGAVLPSQGFFIRHVRDLRMSNIDIFSEHEDSRPAFVLRDVTGAIFSGVNVRLPRATSLFSLEQVEQFTVSQSAHIPDTYRSKIVKEDIG